MIGSRKSHVLSRPATLALALTTALLASLALASAASSAVQVSPPTRDFGSRLIDNGPSQPFQFTVDATGEDPTTIESVAITGGQAAQFVLGDVAACTAAPLAPGTSCTVPVSFDPSSTGVKNATLTITPAAPDEPVTATLTGSGIKPAVQLSPESNDFGNRTIDSGRTPFKSFRFTWNGVGDTTISAVELRGPNRGQFVIAGDSTCVSGGVLATGGYCNVRVAFRPRKTEPGTKTANIAVATTTGQTATASLTGIADPAPAPPPPAPCAAVNTNLSPAFKPGRRKSRSIVIRLGLRSSAKAMVHLKTTIKYRVRGKKRSSRLPGVMVDAGTGRRVVAVSVPGRLKKVLRVGQRVRAVVTHRSRSRGGDCVSTFGPPRTKGVKVKIQRASF